MPGHARILVALTSDLAIACAWRLAFRASRKAVNIYICELTGFQVGAAGDDKEHLGSAHPLGGPRHHVEIASDASAMANQETRRRRNVAPPTKFAGCCFKVP